MPWSGKKKERIELLIFCSCSAAAKSGKILCTPVFQTSAPLSTYSLAVASMFCILIGSFGLVRTFILSWYCPLTGLGGMDLALPSILTSYTRISALLPCTRLLRVSYSYHSTTSHWTKTDSSDTVDTSSLDCGLVLHPVTHHSGPFRQSFDTSWLGYEGCVVIKQTVVRLDDAVPCPLEPLMLTLFRVPSCLKVPSYLSRDPPKGL